MATIHELKDRLASVRSAEKITTALQMVASSKLKKAAHITERFVPFKQMIQQMLDDFLNSDREIDTPFTRSRSIKHVTFVAFSSNIGFCGSFNNVIIERLKSEIGKYPNIGKRVVCVGDKVLHAVSRLVPSLEYESWSKLVERPDYQETKRLADYLVDLYLKQQTDKVILIYFRFKNLLIHELKVLDFLPLVIPETNDNKKSLLHLFILEPPAEKLLSQLMPKVFRSIIYAATLDSFSSEQGARTMAMQQASDNARNLQETLSIDLNRQRQQQITTEILELDASAEDDNGF